MSSMLLLLILLSTTFAAVKSVGVCYGAYGDNLPSKREVINLYKSNGIDGMRIYFPDEETLQALEGSNIEVIIGVPNESLQSLTDASAATDWINRYVKPYSDVKLKYIAVGNLFHPSDARASAVLPVIKNIQSAISAANLQGQIKVSTAIGSSLLQNSYPPSNGAFTAAASSYIKPIITFLSNNGAPLLANIYPYFSYTSNPRSVALDYALFTQQGTNNVGYQNLFDALLDSIYAALEKVGASDMQIVVSETGWPSAGGVEATVDNAAAYYKNLINHVKSGTPKRPIAPIETYFFAMFDENLKPGEETERNFGLFTPSKVTQIQY